MSRNVTPALAIRRRDAGFTLVELMIVLAIIGILAAVAYPSYRESVARGRRAEGKVALLEVTAWIERQYTLSNAYNLLSDGATAMSDSQLPIKEAPKTGGGAKYYDIQFLGTPSSSGFTLQAVPKNAMNGDVCGSLTINQAGTRSVSGASKSADFCWDR